MGHSSSLGSSLGLGVHGAPWSCIDSEPSVRLSLQRALVETHLRQICGLEQQLQQQQGLREAAFPSLSPPPAPATPCPDLDLHYLALRGGPALGHGEISVTLCLPDLQISNCDSHFSVTGHLCLA